MRVPVLVAIALASLALASGLAGAADLDARVLAAGNQFVPALLVVEVGETVTWETPALAHTVSTANSAVNAAQGQGNDRSNGDADPDTFHAMLAPEWPVTHAFAEPGTYTYFCALHRGMVGTIVVE